MVDAILSFANTAVPANVSNYDRHLWIDGSGHLVAGVYPGSVQEVTSTSTVTDGAWHLAAVTLGSSGLSLYLDGVLQQSNRAATPPSPTAVRGRSAPPGWSDGPPPGAHRGGVVLPPRVTGAKFSQMDSYVHLRLARLEMVRHGRRGWGWSTWYRKEWLRAIGVYRLTGTVRWGAAHAAR